MTIRKAKWFVRRAADSRILTTNRRWSHNTGCVSRIKMYSSAGRAIRYGLKGDDGTAYAVYDGDWVNCCGNIKREGCESYA